MRTPMVFLAIWSTVLVPRACGQDETFDRTAVYKTEAIQGFAVLINPEVLEHKDDADAMRDELDSQLKSIVRVLPAMPLSTLRSVRIWVEWEKTKGGAAEFHPSANWLKEHGYNPEKAGGVELSNTRNFVKWSRAAQPWMVLHELAHAYHHRVLGEGHEGIEAAYKQAVERKSYESVDHVNGQKQKAYALTNAKEYYAELSEAYFGRNDFEPFTRADLETQDPVGFRLMEKTWGKPRDIDQSDK